MTWLCSLDDFDLYQHEILDSIIEDTKKSWWIRGYAGTGKTMLLAHIAKEMHERKILCVYATYTVALKNRVIEGLKEVNKGNIPLILTVDELINSNKEFELILIDEVQDLMEEQVQGIINKGTRFILSGDIFQSIFLQAVPPKKLEVLLGKPKIVNLVDIHRFPAAIFYASQLIYDEAQFEEDALVENYKNSCVTVCRAKSNLAEVKFNFEQAYKETTEGKPAAIVFSGHQQIRLFSKLLFESQGIKNYSMEEKGSVHKRLNDSFRIARLPIRFFGGNFGVELEDISNQKIIYLMTVHSAKGLEFNSVFMPFMNKGRNPTPYPLLPKGFEDEWKRRFLYMIMTRARLNFYATYVDEPSEYLNAIDTTEMRKRKYLKFQNI